MERNCHPNSERIYDLNAVKVPSVPSSPFLNPSELGRYITLYADQLHARGYRRQSGRRKLQLAADFIRWLTRNKIAANQLLAKHVRDYLQSRKRSGIRLQLGDRAAIIGFLKLLREQRVTNLTSFPDEREAL